ncbi:DUF1624 domain-containing protein [Dyadobacter crusticola]|uniref:DUF1624 domain-containing protein n=1 Tax=Dyadobacter crusticola TaxID=292407 RepID=UPI000AD4CB1E|nr:heparan-alpha-glucosaminide N-acetyltransferase domain-containing protein [Dyadobacter crusticola]
MKAVQRIQSIDIVRGLIIVIMALDHVRDYFHIAAFTGDPLDPQTTTGMLFFTRWITHFCAPSFMLLSGISAFLSGQNKTPASTSSFLIKRGFWLILVDVIFMTFGFTFDITFKTILFAVLWALGGSMILLGLLVRFLSPRTILAVGLFIVFAHNLLDYIQVAPNSPADIVLSIFFTGAGKFYPRGDGGTLAFLYVIVPWAGIMMSGYGLGTLYRSSFLAENRRKILVITGIVMTILFVLLRFVNKYGDPAPWSVQQDSFRTFLAFMNVRKYPPSLLFTLATQGPILLVLAFAEHWNDQLSRFFKVYGKVPFFFFVVHFYVIHFVSAIAVLVSGYTWAQATDEKLFFKFRPDDFGYSLVWVYIIWILIVLALYFPCKWFGDYRTRERKWWLSYL